MNIRLDILNGLAAEKLLFSTDFQRKWVELALADQKDTVIQEPAFVTSWYKSYANQYEVVLILGYDTENQLIGLMALARDRNSQQLSHVGTHQAEYHGWIAKNGYDEAFLVECLIQCKNLFGGQNWNWTWLPAGTDIKWFESARLKEAGIYVSWQSQEVPIWDLHDEKRLKRSLKNRSFKAKVNRFKRRGELYLEKITDPAQFEALLPIFADQCDFRKEATYDARPFGDDPQKGVFVLERLKRASANHLTVLWLDNQPLAFHMGTAGSDRVHLGISTYDPSESKNSPGSVLMVLLAQMLKEEGFRYFDLTPGNDPYKKRFSNGQQLMYKPVVYFSYARFQKGKIAIKLAQKLREWSGKYGDPHRIRIRIANWKENVRIALKMRARHWAALISKALFWQKQYTLYKLPAPFKHSPPVHAALNHQAFSDLLCYECNQPQASRRKLLSKALDRFLKAEQLFTAKEENQLAHFIWLKEKTDSIELGEIEKNISLPADSLILYDPYSHPSLGSMALLQSFFQQLTHTLGQQDRDLYLLVDQTQHQWIQQAEKLGFQAESTIEYTRLCYIPMGYKQHQHPSIKRTNNSTSSLVKATYPA